MRKNVSLKRTPKGPCSGTDCGDRQELGDPAEDLAVATVLMMVGGNLILLRPNRVIHEHSRLDIVVRTAVECIDSLPDRSVVTRADIEVSSRGDDFREGLEGDGDHNSECRWSSSAEGPEEIGVGPGVCDLENSVGCDDFEFVDVVCGETEFGGEGPMTTSLDESSCWLHSCCTLVSH